MLSLIFFIISTVIFVLAAFDWANPPDINLLALGLAFLAAGHAFSGVTWPKR